jgi:hypothetical protein
LLQLEPETTAIAFRDRELAGRKPTAGHG